MIGALFRDLRKALGLSMPEAAARIGTRIAVIEALETGSVRRLPPWPETVRVIADYTQLARIDPRPVLEVVQRELKAEARTLDLKPAPGAAAPGRRDLLARGRRLTRAIKDRAGGGFAFPLVAGLASNRKGRDALTRAIGRHRRKVIGILAVLPFALLVSLSEPGLIQAVASVLPKPVTSLFSGSTRTYTRNGLVWIEASDPRSRKSDKLQIRGR